jgi:predicted RNA binding protein YcfA (HicA-like mRNA interferase family)
MAKLPSLTAREVIRALKRAGFVEDRQKGSHLVLLHPGTNARTVVPVHAGKTIKPGLLHDIISAAGLSTKEFIDLL